MGRKSHLREKQRAQVVALQQEGYSERQIGARIGCRKNVVRNALEKFRSTVHIVISPNSEDPKNEQKR